MAGAEFATGEDIRRLCWAYVRRYPPSDREDMVQDALLAVLEAGCVGRVPDLQAAYDVARQRMFNRFRAEIRYRRHVDRYGEQRRDDRPVPGERIDIPTYLAALTPRQRLAVELRLWDGLTEAEAGAAMGVSASAARGVYTRAIVRLRGRFS